MQALELNHIIGANVRELRKASNLTQTQLANKLNVRQTTVARIEGGGGATYEELDAIAKSLNVAHEYFRIKHSSADSQRIIFHQRLREIRRENGETQSELAIAVGGVATITVSGWERFSMPDTFMIMAIAKHYNVAMGYLLGLADKKGTANRPIKAQPASKLDDHFAAIKAIKEKALKDGVCLACGEKLDTRRAVTSYFDYGAPVCTACVQHYTVDCAEVLKRHGL